jgi:dTDP-glucose 4,6-dehydratase
MSTILWTGATGFFGRSLLRYLEAKRTGLSSWHFISRDPSAFARHWPELAIVRRTAWHQGDIMTLVESHFPELTHVVHAAADSTSAAHLSHLQRFDQILEGTRRVLDLAVARGAKRLLFTSSGGVYGRQPTTLPAIPEDYLGMPDPLGYPNVYSVAKRAAEHLCALYAEEYGLEIVVARCFAFVGEDLPLDVHFAIGNFIRDALWADEIVVNGDGTPIRSYLDQRDLARWLLALLFEGRSGEAYNVGSDEAITIGDLAHLVRDLVSPGKPVRILGEPVDNAERNRYVPDITKIGSDLGLRPSISLEQAILDSAEAAKSRASSHVAREFKDCVKG